MTDEAIVNISDRLDTNRQNVTNAWQPEELLFAMCGSLSRRVVDPKSPDTCVEWCVSDDADPLDVSGVLSFYYADCGTPFRFFQKSNGFITGNLEIERYLQCIGVNKVQHDPDDAEYQQEYNKVSGRTLRDVFRQYFPASLMLTLELLFDRHAALADDIVRSWKASDFSYVITSHRTNPDRCPLLDYDYIHWLKHEHQKTLCETAISRREPNVLTYSDNSSGGHKYG